MALLNTKAHNRKGTEGQLGGATCPRFFYAHALGPPSSWPVYSSQFNSKQYGGTRVSANETAITFERTARFPFHG